MNSMESFPRTAVISQQFTGKKLENLQQHLHDECLRGGFLDRIQPGQRVAITAGSRGWANRVLILRTFVQLVREKRGRPCIVAAMGSHGGGTPEGRINVLKQFGITEDAVGAPVLSTPEVTVLGTTPSGLKVHTATEALESDWVIVIGRAKPHTSFSGPVESGLHKMMAIGLGKVPGARTVHAQGAAGMCRTIREMGKVFCDRLNVLCGLVLVENAYGETADIRAAPPERFDEADQEGLKMARSLMPKLPVDELDILIVDQMGKNFSGTGIDPKIVGRMRIHGLEELQTPFIKRVGILDLSAESDGNATGVGLADFITKGLKEKIDLKAMYLNCVTSGNVQRAFLPIVAESEAQLLDKALSSLGNPEPEALRYARIQNTRDLDLVEISENVLPELAFPQIVAEPAHIIRGEQGDLPPRWPLKATWAKDRAQKAFNRMAVLQREV